MQFMKNLSSMWHPIFGDYTTWNLFIQTHLVLSSLFRLYYNLALPLPWIIISGLYRSLLTSFPISYILFGKWLKIHEFPVPFYWSFSTSLFLFCNFFFSCSFYKCQQWRKGLGNFSIRSQTFVTPEHIYCFVFCLASPFSKQFLVSAFPEETTSPETRGIFFYDSVTEGT